MDKKCLNLVGIQYLRPMWLDVPVLMLVYFLVLFTAMLTVEISIMLKQIKKGPKEA